MKLTKSPLIPPKIPERDSLETPLLAVCSCLQEERQIVARVLKNKWPRCSCRKLMKVRKYE